MSITLGVQLEINNFIDSSLFHENDFTFIVNGKEYITSSLAAQLISKKIKKNKNFDIGISSFAFNTHYDGDFSHFLNILITGKHAITEKEFPYICEIIEILDCDIIKVEEPSNLQDLTKDNALDDIKQYEKISKFYPKRYQQDIDFISSHFYTICENQKEQLMQLQLNTINDIIDNPMLKLYDEDQLICFLNSLYEPNSDIKYLYEYVNFSNVSKEIMMEFGSIFDKDDMTEEIWRNIFSKKKISVSDKYIKNTFEYNKESPFTGIIHYLCNIKKYDITIESTPVYQGRDDCKPENVILYNDRTKFFHSIVKTVNDQDNWICFDFINYKVILKSYEIRSGGLASGNGHPLNWKIEGSNDKITWEEIDNKRRCYELDETHIIKNFEIDNQNSHEFRYIRMKETGNCTHGNNHYLAFDSFEIYGKLINHL